MPSTLYFWGILPQTPALILGHFAPDPGPYSGAYGRAGTGAGAWAPLTDTLFGSSILVEF